MDLSRWALAATVMLTWLHPAIKPIGHSWLGRNCLLTLRDHLHGNASVCKCMFYIVLANRHMNPVNAVPENALFWNLVSGYHTSTSCLRPLNPWTSHNNNNNNNNNNNGGLHACVRATEDIDPIRVNKAKYYVPLPRRWAKKDYGQPTSNFHLVVFGFSFYCLFVYGAQALCSCSISSSLFLVNFKHHL